MTILSNILEAKKKEIAALKTDLRGRSLAEEAAGKGQGRDFLAALEADKGVAVIAEIKRASPSAGRLAPIEDVRSLACSYRDNGAAAISVITEETFFNGRLDDLTAVRETVEVPVLRKDFILDPVQIHESRRAGADALLLIAAALTTQDLRHLYEETVALGMTPLVEIHDEAELKPVLDLNPPVLAINNRNLKTMDVDLETCLRLRPLVPENTLVVAASGIRAPKDIKRLQNGGIHAFLVGTALVTAADPAMFLRSLCNPENAHGAGEDMRNNVCRGCA